MRTIRTGIAPPPPTSATTQAPTTTAAPTTTTEATTTTTRPATTTMATTGRFLMTAVVGDPGEIVVDENGLTLYLFLPDDRGTPTCSGSCADNWPPLEDGDVAAEAGIDPTLLGSVERGDGSVQVTYDGWPLSYYAADAAPGDARGQGIGGNWWVVTPTGAAMTG